MKRLILFAIISVSITACSCQRNIAERCAAQAELIERQDSLINLIIQDNQDYFLDVLSETDAYSDYLESKQKLNKYGNNHIH